MQEHLRPSGKNLALSDGRQLAPSPFSRRQQPSEMRCAMVRSPHQEVLMPRGYWRQVTNPKIPVSSVSIFLPLLMDRQGGTGPSQLSGLRSPHGPVDFQLAQRVQGVARSSGPSPIFSFPPNSPFTFTNSSCLIRISASPTRLFALVLPEHSSDSSPPRSNSTIRPIPRSLCRSRNPVAPIVSRLECCDGHGRSRAKRPPRLAAAPTAT
ncbi:hypothetical protein B0T14DRAFT_227258 [Immersiella caudata]|uniref:Uncharacterized protein n=1 Tax=Immersiella caudata TaxID=314043 RepID=A0AA40C000_9PEZI|nr:hypothetical protein B0T14DRAFT_227258 [Immersiella caudata]